MCEHVDFQQEADGLLSCIACGARAQMMWLGGVRVIQYLNGHSVKAELSDNKLVEPREGACCTIVSLAGESDEPSNGKPRGGRAEDEGMGTLSLADFSPPPCHGHSGIT